MTHPRPVVPHIHGTVSLPSTGMGSPKLAASYTPTPHHSVGSLSDPEPWPTEPIRSSGRISKAAARKAALAAAERLRSNARKTIVVG